MLREDYASKFDKVTEDSWYIPHHGVMHPTKGKIRVVFHCSASVNGVSLNNCLLQGHDLSNKLVGVLTRFRKNPVAVTGDFEKMFYQVRISDELLR